MSALSKVIPAIGLISAALNNYSPFSYNPGFDIEKVTQLAVDLPTHSWEYGTTGEALLELYHPQFSVFGAAPFPVANLTRSKVKALDYVARSILPLRPNARYDYLDGGNGAAGDPASMGVMAVMLGKSDPVFRDAAQQTVDGLMVDVPRAGNGAISHRASVSENWADFMYMVPPFLAYFAADKDDAGLLQESVRQCRLYREILQVNVTGAAYNGAWRHIIGPESQDTGFWSTGNAWAAGGMARVLATVQKAPVAQNTTWQEPAINELTQYIKEILDGAINSDWDDGLLRNYYQDVGGQHGFGEISGSTMLAAVAFRMAVINPQVFGLRYIDFAERIRIKIGGRDRNGNPHVTSTGIVTPAVNPLGWLDTRPFTTGSPEGQAMTVLMYAAYRDCIQAGVCRHPVTEGSGNSSRRMVRRSHSRREAPHGAN